MFWQRRLTYSDLSGANNLTLFKCRFLSIVAEELKSSSRLCKPQRQVKVVVNVTMKFIRCDTESWSHPSTSGFFPRQTDRHHIKHANSPNMESCTLREGETGLLFCCCCCFQIKIALLCRSRTFVVWVNSFRSVDLTRNVNSRRGNRTGKY